MYLPIIVVFILRINTIGQAIFKLVNIFTKPTAAQLPPHFVTLFLTLYSIITHFDALKYLYHVFETIMANVGANTPFFIIVSKIFKVFFIFSMLSKNRNCCHVLQKAHGVKG